MPYKNPEDYKKWELRNKEKRSKQAKERTKRFKEKNPNYNKEYYQQNKDKKSEYQRKMYHSNSEYRNKDLIRNKTRYKYGKLPEQMVYHHNPPYRVDVWLGVYQDEHNLFH